LFLCYIKQVDSMFPWVCSVIDLKRRQNVVRTSVTHSAIASYVTFLFLPHFDIMCDLLLNRCMATWNLFVKLMSYTARWSMMSYINASHLKSLQSVYMYECAFSVVKLVLSFPLFIIDFWDSDMPPDGTPTVGKCILFSSLLRKKY